MCSVSTDELARLDAAIPDFDWSQLPEGVTRTSFSVPSGQLAAITAGKPGRPRVLLVPGVTGSKEDFSLMLPLLAAAGFHAESVELAGQYESAAAGPENLDPPRRRYDHELFLDDLIAVAEAGPAPVHVLGYSFAGTIAQLACLARPELFASLTLLSCPPRAGQVFRAVKRIGWLSPWLSSRVGAALLIWGIRRNFTKVPPGRHRFVLDRFRLTRRSSVGDIIGLMKRTPDTRASIRALPIPKLLVVGEHDLWPTALHADFAEQLGARFVAYPTGHSPCETTPHQLVAELIELYASR